MRTDAEELPVAGRWYEVTRVTDTLTVITEPYVDALLRANIWHLRGRDRDLVVDAGLGVVPLRPALPELFDRDPVLVVTHAHLDHMGAAAEFGEVRAHPREPLHDPLPGTLRTAELAALLGLELPDGPELMITAAPFPGYDPASYRLAPVPAVRPLADGDRIDLGDRALVALHLPGHTPGSLALFDPGDGTLFSGDVVYDLDEGEELLDEIHGADVTDYLASLTRLAGLPVTVVRPGHGPSFGRDRLQELIEGYHRSRHAHRDR
ncbi:MBL fold metallo-hydrolase [Actinoplanes sp. L3-i22]|uniref:MBL fold metallo-hydrolase n=1 Tax=Actinoplanes sp. L3-i22 TaxID=2836373 RepID=UPI001C77AE4B|nr:MBL fold metallo-hydrolase [Actinoplanes sp. L3-i22]BCY10255.1 MBL fold metallo-hydrolase [Actinoplanes sp. L3-i22]